MYSSIGFPLKLLYGCSQVDVKSITAHVSTLPSPYLMGVLKEVPPSLPYLYVVF